MPFTIAHPAAVVAIPRMSGRRLRLAALVLGSVTPDYQYFVHLDTVGGYTHTLPGLVFVCLPAGWLSLFLFDRLGRRGVEMLLPSEWRLPPLPPAARPPIATSAALLIGAATHVLWDGFTHASGWAVVRFPALSDPVVVGSIAFRWFKILQYGSSVLGIAVLGVLCWRWAARQPRVSLHEAAWRVLLPAGVLGLAGVLNGLRFISEGFQKVLVAGGVAVTFTTGAGLLILGVIGDKSVLRTRRTMRV